MSLFLRHNLPSPFSCWFSRLPIFFASFLPAPAIFWAVSPSSLNCSSPLFFPLSFFVDATLTQEVEKFVSNKSLLNPDIDTSVTIFGRHSGESKTREFLFAFCTIIRFTIWLTMTIKKNQDNQSLFSF